MTIVMILSEIKLEGKMRHMIIEARVNQSYFRNCLISKYKKCCLCNVSSNELLIASHIKPWSASNKYEKLDEDNGLLLYPNHDALFDSGYISFDDNGRILISNSLSKNEYIFMNVNINMRIEINNQSKKYLKYHRENIFRG